MLGFLLWLLVLFLCWPLALLALVLYPLVWLLLLPFRLIGVGVEAVFELLRAIVMLPARILRGNPAAKTSYVQHLTDGAAAQAYGGWRTMFSPRRHQFVPIDRKNHHAPGYLPQSRERRQILVFGRT